MEIISGVERCRRWRTEDKLRFLAEIEVEYGHLLRAGLYSGTGLAHLLVPYGFRICLWPSPELSLDTQEEILRLLECHQRLPQPARSRNLIVEAHASSMVRSPRPLWCDFGEESRGELPD
ncbi:MAG TPA: hypothetical protein VIL69_19075 [Roseomonas sp.]|jgi:hypothetical protein